MWACASGCAMPWCAPIGVFHTWRVLTYSAALFEREAPHPDRTGRAHDPLRVQPGEQLRDRGVLGADERVGGQPHVVEEQLELALRA